MTSTPTLTPVPQIPTENAAAAAAAAATAPSSKPKKKDNSRRLDKNEKNVLLHLLQAPKLTNNDIARIIDVDERTVSRRRKQLRTIGHLSPERNSKGAEKLRPWHLEKVLELLDKNNDLQLKDCQEFLQREFDLHVTLSTISRQLKRANAARATRPGYKATRPDLQGEEQEQEQGRHRQQQQQSLVAAPQQGELQPLQTTPVSTTPLPEQPQQLTPWGRARALAQDAVRGVATPNLQGQDSGTAPAVLRLACPFYRHDPQRYANAHFCHGQWPTARDVKEHIYRQHMVPKYRCNRCMETFPDEAGLVAHQRDLEPCNWAEWQPLDGCTEEQKTKIRKGDKGDEMNRWNRMFRILFPGVDDASLPSALADEQSDGQYFPVAIDPGLEQWEQGPVIPEEEEDMDVGVA